MNLYEKMLTYDIDTMAAHIYGLIIGTEERILASLEALGIDVLLATASEDVRIAQIKQDLLKEVSCGDT